MADPTEPQSRPVVMRPDGWERCSGCHTWHPASAFGPHKGRPNGLSAMCRESANEAGKRSHAKKRGGAYRPRVCEAVKADAPDGMTWCNIHKRYCLTASFTKEPRKANGLQSSCIKAQTERRQERTRAIGTTRFFTGEPCIRGHIAERQASNGGCVECLRLTVERHIEKTGGQDVYRKREAERTQRYEAKVGKEARDAQKSAARLRLLDKDPEYERRKALAWNKANPEKAKISSTRYRRNNPEKMKALLDRWKAQNPERILALARAGDARRRAREQGNGGSYTADDVFELFRKQNGECAYCDNPHPVMEIDHVHPLSKGGRNDKDNLVLACRRCNRQKGAKLLEVFESEIGRKMKVFSDYAGLVTYELIDDSYRDGTE